MKFEGKYVFGAPFYTGTEEKRKWLYVLYALAGH